MSTMTFEGQVALVTGASRGIGRAIAVGLASRGLKVIGTATSDAGAQSVTDALVAHGGRGLVLNVNDVAGVAGMTRALARELGSRNITVNCVAPGFIATDMTEVLPEAQKTALLAQIPLGRLGSPQEIADAVAFLASPQASYITGSELHVNGGMFMS